MIYDAASRDVILFGGYDGTYLGDTWSWNGTTWTQLHPGTAPSPRDGDTFVYDPATKTAILYGGYSTATGRLGDTWSWDGTTWTQLHPATSLGLVSPSRQAAYDTASKQLLLFGGQAQTGPPAANGTWTWTGTTWTRLHPATSPPGRAAGAMTYNSATRQIVMFGGVTNPGLATYPTPTWTWNGSTWHHQ